MAKYGPEPEQAQLASIVRKYLKKRGYYDPNGTEIEACAPAKKGWIAVDAWETDEEGFTSPSKDFHFGWRTQCDINGKNRMGGFVGFETIEYIIAENMVKAGNLPRSSRDNTLTAGGLSGPLWGNR
jgi:hypothetical protein